MKTLLYVTLFVLPTFLNSNAQLVAPLNLNNSWIYEDDLGYRFKETIIDTAFIIDSIKYCKVKIQSNPGSTGYYEYIRLNEDSFYVWWTRFGSSPYYDSPYYKKNAQLGESWRDPIDTLSSITVIDVFPSSVFGVGVNMKILKYSGFLVETDMWWTEEFGRQNAIDFWGYVLDVQKGCVIDGVAYGDTSFGLATVLSEESERNNFLLMQNYPNPFNSSTIIKYNLPSTTFVRLILYNNLGEEVKELVKEEQSAGNYEYEFASEELPSGVYFYSITTNDFTNTKKMILLR